MVRNMKPEKNHCLVLFCSAKSNTNHFTISKIFQVIFSKNQFFHCFDPYTAQVRKMKSAKNKL